MRFPFPSGVLALALAASIGGTARPAHPKPPGTTSGLCSLQGRAFFDKDTFLSDASGRKLARFSGSESPVTLLEPPADASDFALIETGTGRGAFRIQGLIKPAELRVFTTHAVPVVAGHVWIGGGARVTLAGTVPGKLKIDQQVRTPFNQRFSALVDCSSLSFTPAAAPASAPAGGARVYLMKISLLDLYSDGPPLGAIVTTLQRSPLTDSVRFFGTEQRGGFVHLTYQREVLIDGWAKASDLIALARGETSDVPPATYATNSAPQLQLQQTPRIVKASREVPLRLSAKDSDPPIGVIEPDTEVYVMDVMAGWAVVLPQSLHVLPAGELSFWAKASELGI